MSERLQELHHWLKSQLDWPQPELAPASADASFRRYFRIHKDNQSYIIMDAPPDKEDSRPFVQVSEMLLAAGLHVPQILASDLEHGFLLLSDLGDRLYLDELNDDNVDRLYGDAMGALLALQGCGPDGSKLPAYDHALLHTEMTLFRDWLIGAHLNMSLNDQQSSDLENAFESLALNALQQPQVCVHRDFHSRNLMVCDEHNPGVLDYQDAVYGPVTYDLVSLLRDCYIRWPRARVEDWALGYMEVALQSGVLTPEQARAEDFLHWFDWMGVQRHLKAAGIFARLNHRDGKPGYLKDIPRTLSYVTEVCESWPQLQALGEITQEVAKKL